MEQGVGQEDPVWQGYRQGDGQERGQGVWQESGHGVGQESGRGVVQESRQGVGQESRQEELDKNVKIDLGTEMDKDKEVNREVDMVLQGKGGLVRETFA